MDIPPPSLPSSDVHGVRPFRRRIVALVMLIVVLVVGGGFVYQVFSYIVQLQNGTVDLSEFQVGGYTAADNSGAAVESPSREVAENAVDDPSRGAKDAKVVIVAFGDFECPFTRAVQPALRTVLARYDDRVRFVYRDFPISSKHPGAQKAAEAAQCANDQGAFWPYHDLLYERQPRFTVPELKAYATELKLDTATFDNCLDSGNYTAEVERDFQDALAVGVRGTPTFFFNGNPIAGALSEDALTQIIDFFLAREQ